MQQVPADLWAAFERRLDQTQVPADQRPDYHKWVRFYFDLILLTVHGNSLTAPGVAEVQEPAQARAGNSSPQNAGA
jgi:hypothetical protein